MERLIFKLVGGMVEVDVWQDPKKPERQRLKLARLGNEFETKTIELTGERLVWGQTDSELVASVIDTLSTEYDSLARDFYDVSQVSEARKKVLEDDEAAQKNDREVQVVMRLRIAQPKGFVRKNAPPPEPEEDEDDV